ncbi:hypothetical protein [Shewanella sp. YLB-07]|uniref:hypothetical protein n=1 Tax=Shewanella sp. YLB-07 TaxID=2601268 RepID=UPI00128D427D|nr:hypothetical protein [Shewanella sp. YLB-07]MPY24142.1 hypothetical protein [Shewanella sp. YLB-07]
MKAFRVEEVLLNENKEGLKGVKADKCAVNLDIQFDTSFEPQELNHELRPFILSANEHTDLVVNKRRISWLWVSVLVISGHLALVLTLDILWTSAPLLYPQDKIYGIKSEAPQLKGPQLKAYMYYQAPVIKKGHSELIDNRVQEPNRAAAVLTESDVSQVQLKPKSKQAPFVQDPVGIEAKQSLAKQEDVFKPKKASSMSQSSYFFSPEQENNDENDRLNISSFSASTQKYLSRQREAALGEFFVEQANQYTRTKTLSEMDGEMIILELPEIDTWSDAETLDSELDPNRIVKQGDTCYRIVKTPNPINPHAENLGYPFRCDGDSVVAALTRAIAKRVHKRPIKS